MMKIGLIASLFVITFTMSLFGSDKFECNSNSYLFTSKDQSDNYTDSYTINMQDGVIAHQSRFANSHINAIGFNEKDGYIYGWEYGEGSEYENNYDPHLVRVDANYDVHRVSLTGSLPDTRFYLGDINKDGIFYLANRHQPYSSNVLQEIQRVNLNSKRVLSKITLNYPAYTDGIIASDFAFNPKDNQLYMVNANNNQLIRVNPNNGDVKELGYVGNIGNTYSVISFFDKFGTFYFYKSSGQDIYKIDISHPWNYKSNSKATASWFKNITIANSGDGARCASATIVPEPVEDTNAYCYAMPDNQQILYKINMNTEANPLSEATAISLDMSFNGEGSAYRAVDGMVYAFKGSRGSRSLSSSSNSKTKKVRRRGRGGHRRGHNDKDKTSGEGLDDGASGDIYKIDPKDGTITLVKANLLSGEEVEAAEFYFDKEKGKDTLYVITNENEPKLHAFDPNDDFRELSSEYPKDIVDGEGYSISLAGLAIDPNSGEAYASDDYDYDGEWSQLYSLDLETGRATWKVEMRGSVDAEGLAFADDGKLYLEDEAYHIENRYRFYELNPQTGYLKAAAKYNHNFNKDLDIEAISCNGGESIVKSMVEITMSNAITKEGNKVDDNKSLVFNLSFDELVEDINITYRVDTSKNIHPASSDDFENSIKPISLKKGSTSCTISISIREDYEIEYNENLTLVVESDSIKGGVVTAIGTIENDDGGVLNVVDETSSFDWGKKIGTKIVNDNFNLTVLAKNEDNETPLGDVDIKKIEFKSCGGGVFATYNLSNVKTTNSGLVTIGPFSIGSAYKCIEVHVDGQYLSTDMNTTATDKFANRPDRYKFTSFPTTNLVAGENFSITIQAQDKNGNKVSSYEEDVDVYNLSPSQKAGASLMCINGILNMSKVKFTNGQAILSGYYDEVGVINIKVGENSGATSYAYIDGENSLISPDENTSEFSASSITGSWELKNGGNGYTYYSSKPASMGAELELKLQIKTAKGNIAKNFNDSCGYAKDVAVIANYERTGNSESVTPLLVNESNIKLPISALARGTNNGNFSYTIPKDKFGFGQVDYSVNINFQRDANNPMNPTSFTVKDIKASEVSIATPLVETTDKSVTFLYARAHAPQRQSVVGKDMSAVMKYETYLSPSVDKSLYSLSNVSESADSVHWYVLPYDSAFGYKVGTAPQLRFASGATVNGSNGQSISISSNKTPHDNRIVYTPKDYLLFYEFNPTTTHSFDIHFLSEGAKWSGKGKEGVSIDKDSSTKENMKMDW